MADRYGLVNQWNGRRQEQNEARNLGWIGIARVQSRIQLITPFHAGFKSWARQHEGRWRYRAEFWSFPVARLAEVTAAVEQFFSVQLQQPEGEAYIWAIPATRNPSQV